MSRHIANVGWTRGDAPFTDRKYSRRHAWLFDGGAEIAASASPASVPVPLADAAAVDPEEAFVASIASCHMLWFLSIAAKRGHRIDEYIDDAEGFLEKDADGRISMTRVVLRPRMTWSGGRPPSAADVEAMHEEAHRECYIANSVKTAITCEPRSSPVSET